MRVQSGFLLALAALAAGLSAQDDAALAEGLARYERAKDADERVAALEAIAALAGKSPDAEVTRALARGLTDDEVPVRQRAAALVAAAPDRDVAVESLVAGCRAFEKHLKDVRKVKLPKKRPREAPDMFEDPEGFKKWMAEVEQTLKAGMAFVDTLTAEIGVLDALIEALAATGDERAIDGFVILLELAGFGEQANRIAQALLALGTRAAVGAAARHIAALEKMIDAHEKEVKKVGRTRHERPPGYWKGSKEQWAEREEARIRGLVDKAEEQLRKTVAEADGYMACLALFAGQKELPAPPAEARASAWNSWLSRVAKLLPETKG